MDNSTENYIIQLFTFDQNINCGVSPIESKFPPRAPYYLYVLPYSTISFPNFLLSYPPPFPSPHIFFLLYFLPSFSPLLIFDPHKPSSYHPTKPRPPQPRYLPIQKNTPLIIAIVIRIMPPLFGVKINGII